MERRSGVIVLAALAPLVVLAIDPWGWYPFGPGKWLLVSVLVPAGSAALWWSRPSRSVRSVTLTAWLLVGWMAVAAVFGDDPTYAWTGTPERHLGVLAWALCALALTAGQTLDPERDRTVLIWGLTAAGAGAGALAVAEALGFEPSVFAVTSGRLTATMGSAAYLGAAAALLLPALVGIAVDPRLRRAPRLTAATGSALLAVACAGSGARAAWVGLGAAVVVAAVVRRRSLRAHWRGAAVAGALALVAVAAVLVLSPVGARVGAAGDADAAGGRSRVDEWRVATKVIAHHPVVGVGPEGYRVAFAEGVGDGYEQAHGRDPLPDRAHSGPLDVALAGGLPALAIWSVLIGLVLRAATRALRVDRGWLAGIGAGLVAHFVGQLLLFPTAELEPLAWLLAGLLVAATTPAPLVRSRPVARPLVVALGGLAGLAMVAGGLDVAADHRAEAATSSARRGDHAKALAAAQQAADLRPDEVRLHLLLARMLVDAQQGTAPALAAVDDALRISPGDPIARHERARLLVTRAGSTHLPDDISAAQIYVDSLLADDPSSSQLWLLAGSAAELAGDGPAAEIAFRRAESLAPRSATPSLELALLYQGEDRLDDALEAANRAVACDPEDAQARAVRDRVQARIDGGGSAP